MSIQTVATLAQIEFTSADVDTAADLLRSLFNASPVELRFSEALSNEALLIKHYCLGEAMLQFCQPLIAVGMPHGELLERRGDSVHNLTWFVDDIDVAKAACLENEVPLLLEFPMTDMVYSKLLPADNIVDNDLAFIADTLESLGFHLELAELPWKQLPPEPFLCPSYSQPRPAGDDRLGPLQAINIVVPDLDKARSLMANLFAGCTPGDIEQYADVKGFQAMLGGALLCFFTPDDAQHRLARFLRDNGAGVHSLVYCVGPDKLKLIRSAARDNNLQFEHAVDCTDWVKWGRGGVLPQGERFVLDLQQQVGVSVLLCENC